MRRNILFVCVASVLMLSCTNKYEYKQIIIEAEKTGAYGAPIIPLSDSTLNSLGVAGWELVAVYPIIETCFPNFGDSKYVTGIRSNTKTREVVYVFKKRK